MLALGIEYLNGWAMATDPTDRQRPEWPPHPDRVFMALVATYFETGERPGGRAALEWLESLPPPQVVACAADESGGRIRTPVTCYVPANDDPTPLNNKDKPIPPMGSLPFGRKRNDRQFPVVNLDDPVVHLVWLEAAASPVQRDALAALCGSVTRVGHSASLVRMWLEEAPVAPGTRTIWLPTESGDASAPALRMRVSGAGRLARLEAAYNKAAIEAYEQQLRDAAQRMEALTDQCKSAPRGRAKAQLKAALEEAEAVFAKSKTAPRPVSLRPPAARWWGYRQREPMVAAPQIRTTCFRADLVVLRRVSGSRLGLESTLLLTQALHKTLLSHLGRAGIPIPEWLSGHQPDGQASRLDHLALVPLAFVEAAHADGAILGVALAIPRIVGADAITEKDIGRTLGRILADTHGEPVTLEVNLGRAGTIGLSLDLGAERRQALDTARWTRPSRLWASVTPIVLDRHPKKEPTPQAYEAIRQGIAAACLRIGLPEPQRVEVAATSWVRGAPHGRQVPCLQRKDGGNRHHIHALIDFAVPVQGPVLLAAGRYRGYGVCLPLSSAGELA